MNFGPNKTRIEVIREGLFGGIYFRDIYSDINEKMVQKLMGRICSDKKY